jgi:hypothetical protein
VNTTGIFTIHEVVIPFKKFNETLYLIPFGDIHRSSPMCHLAKWKEFLVWASKKKNCYFLGMGDYDDLASASERMILSDKKLHDSSRQTLEDLYRSHTDRLAKELQFMNGKLIGLIEGNHYGELNDGRTTTQLLCEKLQTKYLGVSSFIRLTFEYLEGKSHKNCTIDIWAHHGKGAARLVGGSLNRVQQMAESAHASIYLMGHDHKKSVGTLTRLKLKGSGSNMRLSHEKVLLCRTGSFLKGYQDGVASYVVDNALNPTDLGTVKIEITPKRERLERMGEQIHDFVDVDLHASI